MPRIQIKSWQELPSEGGDSLAFDGERMAVGGPARLCVWQGQTRLATVNAPSPAPGPPRFAGPRVYWGPGFVDLPSGIYTKLEQAQPIVQPGGGERPNVYAWSAGGERLVACFGTGDSDQPVRVSFYDGRTGTEVATLSKRSGLPPQAAWVGGCTVVVGFISPQVFDHSGRHVADIAFGKAMITSIAATRDERRIVAVDLNRSLAWIDTETWTVLDRWRGPWLHSSVSPDGRFVAVIEPWGKLHFACLEADRFKPIGQVAVNSRAVAVALSDGEIAVVGGGEVQYASLKISCKALTQLRSV